MGKGVVTINHGAGLYTATVNYDRTYADTKLTALEDEIFQYTDDIAAQEIEEAAQQVVVDAALLERDTAANTYSLDPTDDNYKNLLAAQATFAKEATRLNAIKSGIALLEIRKNGAEKEIVYINNNIPDDYDVVSWCADYTDDIDVGTEIGLVNIGRVDQVGNGNQIVTESQYPSELTAAMEAEVAELQILKAEAEQELEDLIIEIEGELLNIGEINALNALINEIQVFSARINATNQGILAILAESGYDPTGVPVLSVWYVIQPGKDTGSSAYDAERDGNLTPIVSMSGASAYFNAALLPGVAKWKPAYRIGTVTGVDTNNDTADVDLDYLASSWQGLNVNQTPTLSSVPVEYGICNASVFKIDDRVLIGFDALDWAQPKVIGFESEPRQCSPRYYVFHGGTHYTVWDIRADTIAAIVDPITTNPIPMPATAAEMANWLADNIASAPDGPLYSVSPIDGIQLVLTTAIEGPPIFCIEEPGDPFTAAFTEYEGTSRAAVYSGIETVTRTVVDPCAAFGYSIDVAFDVEDLDPDKTQTIVFVNGGSNMHPAQYSVAVAENNGALYDYRSTLTGSYGGASDGGEGVLGYDGALVATIKTPVGDMSEVDTRDYDNFSRLFGNEAPTTGSLRVINASLPFRDTTYAGSASVQVFVEVYTYSSSYASTPPVLIEKRVIGAVNNYSGSADNIDPLTQTENTAFTSALQDCIDIGITGVGETITSSFYR